MVGSAVEESQLKQIAKRVLLETTGGMRHTIEPEDLLRALDMEIVGVKMSAGYWWAFLIHFRINSDLQIYNSNKLRFMKLDKELEQFYTENLIVTEVKDGLQEPQWKKGYFI